MDGLRGLDERSVPCGSAVGLNKRRKLRVAARRMGPIGACIFDTRDVNRQRMGLACQPERPLPASATHMVGEQRGRMQGR